MCELVLITDPNSFLHNSVAVVIPVPLFDRCVLITTVGIVIIIVALICKRIWRINLIRFRIIARISAAQIKIKVNVDFGRG